MQGFEARLSIPFIGRMITDKEVQDLVRRVNNQREDLIIALREIEDLKSRVSQLENELGVQEK